MGTLGGEVNAVYVIPGEGILAIVYPNRPVTLFGRLFDNVINYNSATLDKDGP